MNPDVLENSRVFVQYEPQTRREGEIQQMSADFPVIELWEVLTGFALGRTKKEQITVYDSVGFALEDFSALHDMKKRALKYAWLESISLIPPLSEPQNLYGLLAQKEMA